MDGWQEQASLDDGRGRYWLRVGSSSQERYRKGGKEEIAQGGVGVQASALDDGGALEIEGADIEPEAHTHRNEHDLDAQQHAHL